MRLLVLAVLAVIVSGLLTAAVLLGYGTDQHGIPRFEGTGIAGKVDVLGTPPAEVVIVDRASNVLRSVPVDRDGSFIARLAPGTYRLHLPMDARVVTIDVPAGECLDVILDFRVPGIVLTVPGEGWPIPALA